MIYGRIEWVGEWSGPFLPAKQTYEIAHYRREETGLVAVYDFSRPRPVQPIITPRRRVGIDDCGREFVLTLNASTHARLLTACFGSQTFEEVYASPESTTGECHIVNQKHDWNECVGLHIIVEENLDISNKTGKRVPTSKKGTFKFTRTEPPPSSWRAA